SSGSGLWMRSSRSLSDWRTRYRTSSESILWSRRQSHASPRTCEDSAMQRLAPHPLAERRRPCSIALAARLDDPAALVECPHSPVGEERAVNLDEVDVGAVVPFHDEETV